MRDLVTPVNADAYSVKHITYKWQDGPTKSVSLADEVQLPQVQVKGYRVRDKLEVLSTGVSRSSFSSSHMLFEVNKQIMSASAIAEMPALSVAVLSYTWRALAIVLEN